MTNETADLLSKLIQSECVNTPDNDTGTNTGFETRNAEILETFFDPTKIEIQNISAIKGRDSLVVKLRGKNPSAPKLLLLPHLDVVPARKEDWDFDPFAGEIKDGFVNGRGAVDMLNTTAAMTIALSELVKSGFGPVGDITLAAVADEEAGGTLGAQFLYQNYPDLMEAQYILGETGGIQMPVGDDIYIPVTTGEKGVHWLEIEIKGTPGHGSKPFGSDNAVEKAAEIILKFKNYKSPVKFSKSWSTFLRALGLSSDQVQSLSNVKTHDETLHDIDLNLAKALHACAHNTVSSNMVVGGTKVNTVADRAVISIDMRSVHGTSLQQVDAIVQDILGEDHDQVSIKYLQNSEATSSPTDTPLWKLIGTASKELVPNAKIIEVDAQYGTDLRFGRPAIAYGAALFAPDISYQEHLNMFHGINERVSVESLRLTTDFYRLILKNFGEAVTH